MFIKLTRLDGAPIWINAAFVVTVEPRKGGGAVVVPVGDGLDYDVRESPEKVLSLLGDAPAPAILPIPTTDALTPTPEDVSAESVAQLTNEARQTPPEKPVEVKLAEPKPAEDKPVESEPAEEQPAKKPVRKTAAKKPRTTRKKKPALPISEAEVERLKKMAPGSVKKLQNTLLTQFKIEDAESAVKALEANGVLTLDRDHVVWGSSEAH